MTNIKDPRAKIETYEQKTQQPTLDSDCIWQFEPFVRCGFIKKGPITGPSGKLTTLPERKKYTVIILNKTSFKHKSGLLKGDFTSERPPLVKRLSYDLTQAWHKHYRKSTGEAAPKQRQLEEVSASENYFLLTLQITKRLLSNDFR